MNTDKLITTIKDKLGFKCAYDKKKNTLEIRIKKQFTEHYAEIKETKEFDEFIVLDKSKPGPFIPYQNAISLNFAEFDRPKSN